MLTECSFRWNVSASHWQENALVPENAMPAIPWSKELGLETLSLGDGLCSMRLSCRPDLTDGGGAIAAGVVASLIDHACGGAIMSRSQGLSISTLNLKIDHVRAPIATCAVTAWAHCYKLSETMAFVRAEAWDREPADIFAAAQGVFAMNRPVAR